jgi:S-DNA-T family DNA segregation ATPase FtsK/SpoIIIE
MPHLLIAGTTGSGKSVCISALVACLIVNNTPDDLRLVLIDPKMVELVRFNGLPHLYGKVETDLDRITGVLRWVTREMDRRYKLFETFGVRNLDNYNAKIARKANAERLPRLVVMIDELADLMMRAPDETERTLVPTSRRASPSPSPPRSTRASSSTPSAPSHCWAAATCSSSARRRLRPCACRVVSSVTARSIGS